MRTLSGGVLCLMEDAFGSGGAGRGRPMRLIRSIQFCCPRPASWSTKLDGYKTLQQPGCARSLQSFHADHEIAAWASPSPRRFPGLQGAASKAKSVLRLQGFRCEWAAGGNVQESVGQHSGEKAVTRLRTEWCGQTEWCGVVARNRTARAAGEAGGRWGSASAGGGEALRGRRVEGLSAAFSTAAGWRRRCPAGGGGRGCPACCRISGRAGLFPFARWCWGLAPGGP